MWNSLFRQKVLDDSKHRLGSDELQGSASLGHPSTKSSTKPMKACVFIIAAALCLAGCAPKSPELIEMSRSFSRRYPEYLIRSVKAGKGDVTRRSLEIEFDAPNNLQNHGRASLVFAKHANGSWKCIEEKIIMWGNS